jgi:hypothetical protein
MDGPDSMLIWSYVPKRRVQPRKITKNCNVLSSDSCGTTEPQREMHDVSTAETSVSIEPSPDSPPTASSAQLSRRRRLPCADSHHRHSLAIGAVSLVPIATIGTAPSRAESDHRHRGPRPDREINGVWTRPYADGKAVDTSSCFAPHTPTPPWIDITFLVLEIFSCLHYCIKVCPISDSFHLPRNIVRDR